MHSGAEVLRHGGNKLVGILNRPEGRRWPAVLFLHGFPGSEKNVDIQRELLRGGIGSFSLHFGGAWGSEGLYRFTLLVEQARAALSFLRSRPGVDPARLAVFGYSMGGWAALNLAPRERLRAVAAVAPVGGPEMISPYNRAAIARKCRPLRVGSTEALCRDFTRAVRAQDPAEAASRLSCPLLLVHGEADDVVRDAVSKRIFAAARRPKRLILVPGANHGFLDRRAWLTRLVAGWLSRRLLR